VKWFNSLSFVSRIGIAMLFSLVLNFGLGSYTKNQLSDNTYVFELDVTYNVAGTIELLFDTGNNFNSSKQVVKAISKGQNKVQILFEIEKKDQLKFLRLDFGKDTLLTEISIQSMSLSDENENLFKLKEKDILTHIILLQGIDLAEQSNNLIPKTSQRPFDPYIVFSPVNELMYPLWQRTSLLLAPWFLMFFFPIVMWIKERLAKNEFALLFVAFFLIAIPLKIAWVTFTSLLLFAYALYEFYKKKDFNFGVNHFFLCLFIIVPILFLGQGDFSKIIMPLGLLLWVFSGSILRNSIDENKIKLIYISVFTIVMGITLVSWASLLFFEGYFYGVNTENYFYLVKWKFHHVLYWLYFDHPNFLSFFVTIGAVFCLDLYRKNSIPKSFGVLYAIFAISFALILGSRFALLLLLCSPLLYLIPIKSLSRYIFISWAVLSSLALWVIKYLDAQREQIWSLSIAAIKEKPWFGYGTGSSSTILPASIDVNQNDIVGVLEINHSHNQIVSYALENGVLGALIIVVGLALIICHFGKQRNRLMLIVTFMLMLLMIIEAPFRTTTPLYVIGFLYAIFGNETILKTKSN